MTVQGQKYRMEYMNEITKQVWLGRAHIKSMHKERENLQIHQEQKIGSFGEIRQLELCRIFKGRSIGT